MSPAGGCAPAPPAYHLRRLDDSQLRNAIRDLTSADVGAGFGTPGGERLAFERVGPELAIGGQVVSLVRGAAMRAGAVARGALGTAASVLPCTGRDEACATTFIRAFAGRAYRRPLGDDEVAELLTVFRAGAGEGYESGVGLVVETVLQAPSFLYRLEGLRPGRRSPTPSGPELAGEVALLLLDSIADGPLHKAGESGALLEPRGLAAEVERLLALPRVRKHVEGLVLAWLDAGRVTGSNKDTKAFPAWSDGLKQSLIAETRRTVTEGLWQGSASLRELLSSRRSFLDANLARLYGVDGRFGNDLQATPLPPTRMGLLTQGTFLAGLANEASTGVVHRGLFVRQRLLCLPPAPAPDPNAVTARLDETKNLTEASFAQYRLADPVCGSCHRLFDPLGLLFERYDPIGRYRERDGAAPIDPTLEITLPVDFAGRVAGAVDLAGKLAESPLPAACLAQSLARHATGQEGCPSGGASTPVPDLLRRLILAPTFAQRR